MERQFGLPVTFAAVAHAALFFGFTETPRAVPAPEPKKPEPTFVVLTLEEPPPLPEASAGGGEKTLPDVPRPQSQEPQPLELRDVLTMKSPPIVPTAFTGVNDVKVIPLVDVRHASTDGIGQGPGPILSGDLDNPPRTRFQSPPIYPFEARQQNLNGEVMVEFTVDESGRVLDPRIVSSSHRMFEDATLRAVSKWQFEPGRRHGRVVRFRMAVPVLFNLND